MNPVGLDSAALNNLALFPDASVAGQNANPSDDSTGESDIDDLVAYKSLPPRRTITLTVCCSPAVQMTPLPYLLEDEEDDE